MNLNGADLVTSTWISVNHIQMNRKVVDISVPNLMLVNKVYLLLTGGKQMSNLNTSQNKKLNINVGTDITAYPLILTPTSAVIFYSFLSILPDG